jgi:hypothetical protein
VFGIVHIVAERVFSPLELVMFYTPFKVVYLWISDKISSYKHRMTASSQRRK